jgi:hypothetical protein
MDRFLHFAILLSPLAACSLWNRIDTCRQAPPEERTINQRFHGDQFVSSPTAAAALPGGGAVVAFDSASEVSARSVDLLLAVLTPDGHPKSTCAGPDETVAAAGAQAAGRQLRQRASVAGPAGPGRVGLVVYEETLGGQSTAIWGRFFAENGCAKLDAFPIGITSEAPGGAAPQVVNLRSGEDQADFAVLWLDRVAPSGVRAIKARVVRYLVIGPKFLPSRGAPDGSQAWLPAGTNARAFAAASGTPGRLSTVWLEGASAPGLRVRPWMASFDQQLKPVGKAVALGGWAPAAEADGAPEIAAAHDGRSLLVAWLDKAEGDESRMRARAVDDRGAPIGRPGAPDGAPLRLGEATQVADSLPSAAALSRGGFLVAWREVPSGASEGHLRAVALRGDGSVRFNARACDAASFELNCAKLGDQRQPALALLPTGALLAAWTDLGKNGADPSGSIRGALLRPEALFADPERSMLATVAGDEAPSSCLAAPGSVAGGLPCLCASDCAPGATCEAEEDSGRPGGACHVPCDASAPGACGSLQTCVSGRCEVRCTSAADCPAGRICRGGTCSPFCAGDEDCRSGLCDLYRHLCADGSAPSAPGGVDAACAQDEDCRSGICEVESLTCRTYCRPSRPNCPEDAHCQPVDLSRDVGVCHRTGPPGTTTALLPCRSTMDCPPGGLCLTQDSAGSPGGACLVPCSSDSGVSCGAAEICVDHRYCATRCSAPSECPEGRACSSGVCTPFCAFDRDCAPGFCNTYSGACVGQPIPKPQDPNVEAPCADSSDCLSEDCDPGAGRCVSRCQVSRPNCPDRAQCHQSAPNDDLGKCRRDRSWPLGPCAYTQDCDGGATCFREILLGYPLGACCKLCSPDSGTSCAAGQVCIEDCCAAACRAAADCPPGRVCHLGGCVPRCAHDGECDSGHCNPYRGLCDDGSPRHLRGLDEACEGDGQCESGACDAQVKTCSSFCKLSDPSCPEGAACHPIAPGDDLGQCHK